MEVGEILHQARSGRFIIKLERDVRIGEILLDIKGKKIAKVMEIIGPIDAPYASAQPLTDRIKKYIGSKVYAKHKKRKR